MTHGLIIAFFSWMAFCFVLAAIDPSKDVVVRFADPELKQIAKLMIEDNIQSLQLYGNYNPYYGKAYYILANLRIININWDRVAAQNSAEGLILFVKKCTVLAEGRFNYTFQSDSEYIQRSIPCNISISYESITVGVTVETHFMIRCLPSSTTLQIEFEQRDCVWLVVLFKGIVPSIHTDTLSKAVCDDNAQYVLPKEFVLRVPSCLIHMWFNGTFIVDFSFLPPVKISAEDTSFVGQVYSLFVQNEDGSTTIEISPPCSNMTTYYNSVFDTLSVTFYQHHSIVNIFNRGNDSEYQDAIDNVCLEKSSHVSTDSLDVCGTDANDFLDLYVVASGAPNWDISGLSVTSSTTAINGVDATGKSFGNDTNLSSDSGLNVPALEKCFLALIDEYLSD